MIAQISFAETFPFGPGWAHAKLARNFDARGGQRVVYTRSFIERERFLREREDGQTGEHEKWATLNKRSLRRPSEVSFVLASEEANGASFLPSAA